MIAYLQNSVLLQGVLYALAAFVIITLLHRIFNRLKKNKNSVYMGFIQGVIEAVIVIFALVRIMSLSSAAEKFYNTIILSSSLIVVVLGFVFQEGTKNIVHGFFVSIYRPFEIGDWIDLTVGGREITGYVESMNLRHTVVRNFYTGFLDMIPNAELDTTVIENARNGEDKITSKPVEVQITYESDLKRAKEIMAEIIMAHPSYIDVRKDKSGPIKIYVSDLAAHGILLKAMIKCQSIEECFDACSDIREQIFYAFKEEGIDIAYEHLQLMGKVAIEGNMQQDTADRGTKGVQTV